MLNAERSPTFYRFDSLEQLRVWREMDDRDEEPVVIYHSHTATEAYPSRTDISYASEPGAHYVLVSTREPDRAEFRSFRIVDGEVTEEEVRVTDGGDGAAADGPGRTSCRGGGMIPLSPPVEPLRRPQLPRPTGPHIWSTVHGHRGPHPDHPSYLHRRREVGRGLGRTLAELLGDLDSRHQGLRERLVDDAGLRRFVNVYLNDEDVRFLGGLETPVTDGDTVTVLPAVAGGSR